MLNEELCFLSATEQSKRIREKSISAQELIRAHLDQIEKYNPILNAIVTLTADSAMAEAHAADKAQERGEKLGVLHGLPVAHKDLFLTKGVRTTFGSLAYKDFVPDVDSLPVERLKKRAVLVWAKQTHLNLGPAVKPLMLFLVQLPIPMI